MIASQPSHTPGEKGITASIKLTQLRFVSGDSISLEENDVIIVVGPNNVGKTALIQAIRDKLKDSSSENPVLESLSHVKQGEWKDLLALITQTAKLRRTSSPSNRVYSAYGENTLTNNAKSWWDNDAESLGTLSRYFCHYLTTEARLSAGNPAPAIALTTDPPTHPIHFVQKNDLLEETLSSQFRQAFGLDLIVHRNAGSQVPLYTGDRPTLRGGEDRVSISYTQRLEDRIPLAQQGDGMRSFASVLLHTVVGQENVLLIDEPEAFLHPPQARLLGQLLVQEKPESRQLFVATHSGDVVRGVLDAGSQSVRVLRLDREGDVTSARELSNAEIETLWSDSLLRHSNILDGLFHSRVVICEGDSDARFYSAIASAVEDKSEGCLDIMFTHSGGKQRLPVVARALHGVNVPVRVVADFDILREEQLLSELVGAVGGDWERFHADWTAVRTAIDSKKPELNAAAVGARVREVLDRTPSGHFPATAREEIRRILAQSSLWSIAKTTGKSLVPSGTPTSHCEQLLEGLASIGIHVVPVGESEGFVRKIGGHGQSWVNEVLKLDLATCAELDKARQFVQALVR